MVITLWSAGRAELEGVGQQALSARRTSAGSQSTVASGCIRHCTSRPCACGSRWLTTSSASVVRSTGAADDVLPGDPREVDQVVDQARHPVGAVPNPPRVVLRPGVERGAGVVEQQLGEAADVAQGVAEIVRDGVQHRFQLGRGGAQRGAPLRHPALELAGLAAELLPEPGLLDGDGQRCRDLHCDVPVFRREAVQRARGEVHLPDGLRIHQERHAEDAAHALVAELPDDRGRGLDRGQVVHRPHRAPSERLGRRELIQRNRAGGKRRARRRTRRAAAPGRAESRTGCTRAAVTGHHPPHPAERRAADLRGRAGRQDRLIQVVQHGKPLGRAPEPLLGALPLGDVGDHADGAHHGPFPPGDRACRHQAPQLGAVLPPEAQIMALAVASGRPSTRWAPARAVTPS